MNRKDFIKRMGFGAGAITLSPLLVSCLDANSIINGEFQLPLALPPELIGTDNTLNASPSNITIGDSYSISAFRFNNSVPGPTIRKKWAAKSHFSDAFNVAGRRRAPLQRSGFYAAW